MWESAQDRDLPECGFPKMGPQNRPTLVILIRKSNGFGVRIKLVTSSPPALNDIWLGPSFLVGVNIWKSRTESYWYWEFGQTRSTDFLNRHAPMRKTINRVDAFWWSMLLPKKKIQYASKYLAPSLDGWTNPLEMVNAKRVHWYWYPDSADASVLVEAAYWYSLTDFEQSLSTFQGDISVGSFPWERLVTSVFPWKRTWNQHEPTNWLRKTNSC